MHPRHYLILSFGLTAVLTGGIAAVNAHLDPYGLSAAGRGGAYEGVAGAERSGSFWQKALAVRDARPRSVILGTSRADGGIDTRHPGFSAQDAPVFNLALGGLSVDQMRLLLIHAHAISPVRKAVIGLDLEAFLGGGRTDFDPAGLEGNPETEPYSLVRLRLALSRETLSASLARWAALMSAEPVAGAARERSDPQPRRVSDELIRQFGQRGLSAVTEFNNFYSRLPVLFPRWLPATRWSDDPRRAATMTAFRDLLGYARQEGIELRMFISPVHARYLEWYRQVGWWPLFEAWKRSLVAAIDDESRANPGRPAFPLWDFGGFHALATEPVPKMGDLSTRMRWYLESSHYSPELGDLVLDRVLGAPGAGASPLPDLRIDAATIDRHLSMLRSQAEEYRYTHPGEVGNVSEMIAYLRRVARK
jgi:hypothetical protein